MFSYNVFIHFFILSAQSCAYIVFHINLHWNTVRERARCHSVTLRFVCNDFTTLCMELVLDIECFAIMSNMGGTYG